jgi:hypothetical protein
VTAELNPNELARVRAKRRMPVDRRTDLDERQWITAH